MRWCELGGYSAFFLAGIHNNRFKTFIAHDGVFNTQSMFGTTGRFLANWDLVAYWEKTMQLLKTYTTQSTSLVEKWNTPILIFQGGKDFQWTRSEAFQAALGSKSRFVYFPKKITGYYNLKMRKYGKRVL
jgi:dipeptidyl aminopeptidase/acylaminoacyl peptidase